MVHGYWHCYVVRRNIAVFCNSALILLVCVCGVANIGDAALPTNLITMRLEWRTVRGKEGLACCQSVYAAV